MSEEGTPSKKELKVQRKEAKRLEKEKRNLLTVSENCKGCGAYMSLDQPFCSGCGAKRMYNRLNWRNLLEDFTDRFLNMEAQFPKTFITLFTKPEDVIDGYINGTRKKYLSAFSYFAISLTLTGIYMFVMRSWYMDQVLLEESVKVTSPKTTGVDVNWVKDFLGTFLEYQSFFTFLSIPLLAVISKMVFWNYKKYNFIEHIVIYLYAYSHVQIISAASGILAYWSTSFQIILSTILSLGMIVYMAFVLQRMFRLTIEKILLKTLLFFVVAGVFLTILSVVLGFIGVYLAKSGALDGIEVYESFKSMVKNQAEMQKTLKEAALQAKDSIRMDSIKRATRIIQDTIPQVIRDTTKISIN